MFEHGVEMQQAGDYMGAIDAYKTVLSLDPKRLDALSNLGASYVHLGQFDEGIAQYQTALAIDPQNIQVRLNLGLAYYKSGRIQRGDRAAEAGGGVAGPAEERAAAAR